MHAHPYVCLRIYIYIRYSKTNAEIGPLRSKRFSMCTQSFFDCTAFLLVCRQYLRIGFSFSNFTAIKLSR